MTADTFRAGVGRVDITPPLTMPHASWGAQVHVFPDGVESALWATALVVDDGTTKAVWIDLDVVIITATESDAIRAMVGEVLDIPAANVRVSVTHNHAGPPPSAWNWTRQGQAAFDGYFAMLPKYAAGAARAAQTAMRPARLGVGSGQSRVAVNRREFEGGRTITGVNPDGFIDPEVFVVRIDDTDGASLACIVGYTMHPTTMGPSNRRISADWPGYLKRTVESLTGATCLFAQGATGNVGPGPEGFTDDPAVIRKLGARVGCVATDVYLSLDVPPVRRSHDRVQESGAPLSRWKAEVIDAASPTVEVRSTTVNLPLIEQPAASDAQARVEAAEALLHDLRGRDAPLAEIEAATFATKRANMSMSRVRQYGGKTHAPIEVQLFRIGDVAIVGAEGEPFAEIGVAIKDGSPFPHTWFSGYTGGWAGYIPTAADYPHGGYEVEISPFAPEAAQVLIDETLAFLTRVATEERA